MRIGKADSVRQISKTELKPVRQNLALKVRLYESLVLSTMFDKAELWFLLFAQKKNWKQHITSFSDGY